MVSQLAATRGTTLREPTVDGRRASIPSSTIVPNGSDSAAISFAPIAPGQLARDIAEIEQAAAALRRAEPALKPRAPDPQTSSEPRPPRSIWLLVGVIWLTAAAVVSCAIGAIVLLFR